MKSVLVVEDEIGIHDVLEFYLEDLELDIKFAASYEEAISCIERNNFDLILSDLKLGDGLSGADLLSAVQLREKKIPFIVMTCYLSCLDAREAYKLGVDEFLAKPINQNELQTKIISVLNLANDDSYRKKEMKDSLFCEIPIHTFVSGKQAPFDIYIRIRANKYIKIAHRKDEYNYEILNKFKRRGIEFLHVIKDEFKEYTILNLKVCKSLGGNNKIPKEKVNNFLIHTNNVLQETVFNIGFDEQTVRYLNFYSKTMVDFITKSKCLFDLSNALMLKCPKVYNYSLLTAVYSLYIAQKLEWESDERKTILFLSGMLHDIGMKDVPTEILEKDKLFLSDEEKELLDEHPRRGMELLNSMVKVPSEVILAAYQHHETVDGQGYPQKLRSAKISPFSKIIYIASSFAMYYIDHLTNGDSNSSAKWKSYNRVVTLHESSCDKVYFEAFKSIFS